VNAIALRFRRRLAGVLRRGLRLQRSGQIVIARRKWRSVIRPAPLCAFPASLTSLEIVVSVDDVDDFRERKVCDVFEGVVREVDQASPRLTQGL
jgi:hypothetical protein